MATLLHETIGGRVDKNARSAFQARAIAKQRIQPTRHTLDNEIRSYLYRTQKIRGQGENQWLKKYVLYGSVICLPSPVRRLFQNPDKILGPYIEDGMTVLDIGCAMGFFSLPAAQMVGPNGKVICIDIQEKMIKSLNKHALKAGVTDRIEPRICTQNSLELNDITEKIDFAFAIAVAHEIPDVSGFFSEIYKTLKPGHKFLVVEPKGHISQAEFENTVSIAREKGFTVIDRPGARSDRVVVLKK